MFRDTNQSSFEGQVDLGGSKISLMMSLGSLRLTSSALKPQQAEFQIALATRQENDVSTRFNIILTERTAGINVVHSLL